MSCIRLVAVLALFALCAQAQDIEVAAAAPANIEEVTGISAAAASAIAAADPQFIVNETPFLLSACTGAEPGHEHDHSMDVGVQIVGAAPDASDPDISLAFSLQSKPSAKAKIFLNFAGCT
jgi:hypothetical protein